MKRTLVIHAGTHKTASSYIQSRVAANSHALNDQNIFLRYPDPSRGKHKPLARSLAKRGWRYWRGYLGSVPDEVSTVFLSGEQFTQPLAKKNRLEPFVELLEKCGYQLRLVVFLRDQPDYINARYVHSARRLYHHQSFAAYVEEQLAHRRRVYDYSFLFRHWLSDPRIVLTFLPYSRTLGDPYERMAGSLGWCEPASGWQPADPSKGNVQPGCRGVWLAQAVGRRLEQLGIKGRSLVNAGAVIRSIAEQQGWIADRYWGFDGSLAARVSEHYAESNDRFAHRVWQCPWRQVVAHQELAQQMFDPPVASVDHDQLDGLVRQALSSLAKYNRNLVSAMRKEAWSIFIANRFTL